MFPINYGQAYKTPDSHQPPDETDLANNTEYPNLNSRDYAKRPLNHLLRMHSAWECITLNNANHTIIATNKLSGREWSGSMWGFENLDDGFEPAKACFKLQCNAIISKVQFISKNMFMLAFRSGNVQVWSTRNGNNPYNLFLIGQKCEHVKPILCMDVMKSNINRAVTGSEDGTIKLWDMGSADLFSTHTFRFAHSDSITGVESSRRDASIFATCSLDKSALIWDDRLTRPAVAIYENHSVRFKNLAWYSQEENTHNESLIYLGDESGLVHSIDVRLPNNILKSTKYLCRPIKKIIPDGQKLAVIGDTNIVKIANVEDNNNIIYENADSQNFIRDAVWLDSKKLLTVGFEGKVRVHKIH